MRQDIALYIGGQRTDLDEQSFILFNYTMEDLNNPTIVNNSFSKQITLKGTPNNNRIFGNIFRLDRLTSYESEKTTGVYFDPMRRTPFVIYNGQNEVVEEGYVKLDEVVRSKKEVEYKITLFGGLGSFFYGLMYDESGEKKTLGSLTYKDLLSQKTSLPGFFGQNNGYYCIKECWSYLRNTLTYKRNLLQGRVDTSWCNIVNFAPAYNGIQSGFDAKKAVVSPDVFKNINVTKTKEGTSTNLVVFSNPHSEWEMKELRWYLQRPVFSIKALFEAIADPEQNGGYNVTLETDFFNTSNELYENGWFTLPMIPIEQREWNKCLTELIGVSTKSPAEYLISFAKVFGLVFVKKGKDILIQSRQTFYYENRAGLRDITDRVRTDSIRITPVVASSRFYQFGSNVIGEWAKQYKNDYGKEYAIQRINTGNQFNQDTEILTKDILYKDAVEVQERNVMFQSNAYTIGYSDSTQIRFEHFILPRYESVKLQSWNGDEMTETDVIMPTSYQIFPFNSNLSDWLPKVQLHDEDNKDIDGSDVLLVFNEVKSTPNITSWGATLQYRLTGDTSDMMTLNEGVPCYNFSNENSTILEYLPSFRRNKVIPVDGDDSIAASFEWGIPMARGVNALYDDAEEAKTIFNLYWKRYLSDRYDDDSFRMTCKVDLRGYNVGQELFGKFFLYEGSVFVLNKITNHSLTSWDDTECEFIRVIDRKKYYE